MRNTVRAVPVLAWAGLIFAISSFSNPPGATGGEPVSQLAHVVEYAVLGFLLARFLAAVLPHGRQAGLAAAWLICVLYGVSDEWHQSFVPNRDSTIVDVYFDAAGAALGTAAWALSGRWRGCRGAGTGPGS